MAHVLSATLRLSQRASTRNVSHVLSGSTRSLSSTSSPAVRGCAARNASFVTAFSTPRPNNVFSNARAFSTRPEEVEARAEPVFGEIKETLEQTQTEQSEREETRQRRRWADQQNRVQAPSDTLYVSSLPFFATEDDLRRVFEGCGTISKVQFFENGKQQGQIRVAFVTMASIAEAATILESAKQEPFVLEGRSLRINWANRTNPSTPSNTVYFKNFNDGDLGELRDFLGDLSGSVDKAWFTADKSRHDAFHPSGIIVCRDIESATAIVHACNGKPGPDGLPVLVRYYAPRSGRKPASTEE